MKYSEGVLQLVWSKNPPVFRPEIVIQYQNIPKRGQAFLFTQVDRPFNCCNLSTVQKVSKFDGFFVIQTLNSYYTLKEEQK